MEKKLIEKLIKKSIDGDERAFRELYDKYKGKIFKTAYLMLRDEKGAEDIVQEVFITVYKKIYKLKYAEAFESWLYKITINRCNEYFRKNSKAVVTDEEDMYQIYDTDIYAQPDERLLTEERNQQLDRIINSLSEKLKTCIILFYYNNMTIKQIADILGCSEGTVKSRLFKAKRAIEKKLNTELVKEGAYI